MLRKTIFALAAIIALGALVPTEASARWHGGWHGGGGWRGPGWGWGYPYAYAPGPYYYAGGCWQPRRVGTPYGWRLRRVWVCG
jgi:uncharacterized membrane protein